MKKLSTKILMITPYAKVQRGNTLTTARIHAGLTARGFQGDILALENPDWPEQLQLVLEQSAYNLVHGFNALYLGQVLESFPALKELPIILTTTGTDIYYDLLGAYRNTVLLAMQAGQKIVLFNEDSQYNLQSRFPEFRHKFITIPQGVWLDHGTIKTREEFGLAPDEFIFLLPSGLRAVKNIELAIDALAVLHKEHPHIRLLIIGAVVDAEYGRVIIERMRSLPWITYLGEIPHEQMAGVLALGDVVLNTSHSEGQPQAALEAMSLGKPCIMTAVPGNLNLIQAGREGFYINNKTELVAAAQTLLTNPRMRSEMGKSAKLLAATRFTLERELDTYSRLYDEALGINPVED